MVFFTSDNLQVVLEMQPSHCVLNHNVEIECENSHKHNYIWYHIQGVPGGIYQTSGECSSC